MKPLIAILCLISTVAFAQIPQMQPPIPRGRPQNDSAPGEALPENYLLTLVVSDKDQVVTELSVVVATTHFDVQMGAPVVGFVGTLTPDDKEGILVRYNLATTIDSSKQQGSHEYFNNSVAASVKVRQGEPLQILKSGTQTYKLTVSRLSAETHKNK